MTRRIAGWIVAGALALAPSACSTSPNPTLYTIAPVDPAGGADAATPGKVPAIVVLQPIALARYLERQQIVRSSENYQLNVTTNDWWGEPLGAMINRVLVQELSQRLPKTTILSESGAVSGNADATVALNILRLDQDASGSVILQAQASVTSHAKDGESPVAPLLQSFRFSVTPSGPDVKSEVAAISNAVGQLADKLAYLIATGRQAP